MKKSLFLSLSLATGLSTFAASCHESEATDNKSRSQEVQQAQSARTESQEATKLCAVDESLRLETLAIISKGEKYLISKQNENGSWGPYGGFPAYTALVATSLKVGKSADKYDAQIRKGADSIAKLANPDGSICEQGDHAYPNYTTSVAAVALYTIDKEKYKSIIRKARGFILSSQFSPEDGLEAGGIGYGSNKNKSDLSNTQLALEALYVTADLDRDGIDPETAEKTKLAWQRALKFVTRCQNLESNDLKWSKESSAKKDDRGSFIYSPDRSKVEDEELRGYGSMTYAGLKSMIYAEVSKEDPRVKAAITWLADNYTMKENPGLKLQGHYYYLHTMSKALHAANINVLTDSKGKKHYWRTDLAKAFIQMQQNDGSWINTEKRWQENSPELVTAYSLIALAYTLAE